VKPELIVMLTNKDQTVKNALSIFQEVKDTPVTHWGFKDIGLNMIDMQKLVNSMKDAGKITYLEIVSLSEVDGLQGAKMACQLGLDILMGTVFYPSILAFLQDKPIKYYPFAGHVYDHPSILGGSIDEIVKNAKFLMAQGVDGLDLLTYRYTGDAAKLLKTVVDSTNIPIVSAGSIASYERIFEVWRTGARGFTIGTAFFEKKFAENGSFRDNIMAVWDWLQATDLKT
jgi:glycerol-3-phosphate responsive antiterminator